MTDFRSPEHWIEAWDALAGRAGKTSHAGYASARTWDCMAASYGRGDQRDPGRAARADSALRAVERRGIDLDGRRVLDVGCGHGRHAVAFAKLGAEVTALDFSTSMLDRLQSEIPPGLEGRIHPVRADWEDVDLAESGWTGAFDLAFAYMTPAIKTPAAFLKLQEASRRWCLYGSWAGPRVHPLLDRLRRELGVPFSSGGSWSLLLSFNLLFTRGIYPDIEFAAVSFERREPIERAAEYFTQYFSGLADMPRDVLEARITALLDMESEEGLVKRKTAGRTGTMTWRIDPDAG